MRLSKLIDMTKNGECLTNKQTKQLAQKLNLESSPIALVLKSILAILLLVISLICFLKGVPTVACFIILGVSIGISLFVFLFKNNTKKIILYLDALKEIYIERVNSYEGFESVFLSHQFQRNGYLQNKLCVLLTDGYDFYIMDDIFKETEYNLPRTFKCSNNRHPVLKVLDSEFATKRPLYFKLSEIAYYQLSKPNISAVGEEQSIGFEYRRYTYLPDKYELDEYCILELTDHSVFKLSANAIDILRRKAPGKERI